MADLDGDGHLDLVSGSWPGEIYVFAGGDDAFDPPIKLKGPGDRPINVGRASAVDLHDWDGDGDEDLLIGVIEGDVYYLPNAGGEGMPSFGEKRALLASGKKIRVGTDAGPVVADWDGDGLDDLIVGDGRGAVWWYRAEGSGRDRTPTLGSGVQLIKPSANGSRDGAPTRSGIRAKVDVTDWNGDGMQDLLVGDFATTTGGAIEADDDESNLQARLDLIYAEIDMQIRAELGVAVDATLDDEQQARHGEMMMELMLAHDEFQELQAELGEIYRRPEAREAQTKMHGWVWVYLREAGATPDVDGAAASIDIATPTPDSPVSAAATVTPKRANAGDVVTLVVRMKIAKGWHIYASVPPTEAFVASTLKLDLPDGIEAVGDWTKPAAKGDPLKPMLRKWTGDLVFSHELRIVDGVSTPLEIACRVDYQCCDPRICFPPTSETLTTTIEGTTDE